MPSCNCTRSDAWRCAVDQGRTDVIACTCGCHRAVSQKPTRDASPSQVSGYAQAYHSVDKVTLDAILKANKDGLNGMAIIGASNNTSPSSDHNILLIYGAGV